jgi:soluble lytic murein transglycosylase-like protein
MRRIPDALLRWSVFLAVACGMITVAGAAETNPAASSDFRLHVKLDTFRLVDPNVPQAPQPEPRQSPPIPAHLADKPYALLIQAAALAADIEPALVHAIIHVESRYNPQAISPKGAVGLMQVMPDTAQRYGIKNPAQSPAVNLRAGTRYLKDLMQMFNGRLDLVLAAYNAGEKAVLHYGLRIPPYAETQAYVPAVLAKYREWRQLAPPPTPAAKPVYLEYLPGTRLDPKIAAGEPHSISIAHYPGQP